MYDGNRSFHGIESIVLSAEAGGITGNPTLPRCLGVVGW